MTPVWSLRVNNENINIKRSFNLRKGATSESSDVFTSEKRRRMEFYITIYYMVHPKYINVIVEATLSFETQEKLAKALESNANYNSSN